MCELHASTNRRFIDLENAQTTSSPRSRLVTLLDKLYTSNRQARQLAASSLLPSVHVRVRFSLSVSTTYCALHLQLMYILSSHILSISTNNILFVTASHRA